LVILNKLMKKVKITPRLLVAAVVAVIVVMKMIRKRNKSGRMRYLMDKGRIIRKMEIIIIRITLIIIKEVLDEYIKCIN